MGVLDKPHSPKEIIMKYCPRCKIEIDKKYCKECIFHIKQRDNIRKYICNYNNWFPGLKKEDK